MPLRPLVLEALLAALLAAIPSSAQEQPPLPGADPGATTPAAAPGDPAGPAAAPAEPVAEQEVVTRLQIFLDQKQFCPGKIDGRWGEFTGKALAWYARANGLPADESLYGHLPLAELHPIYTTYTVAEADLAWVGPVASKPAAQAKLKKLLYGGLLEFVSERFHSDPLFLKKLNAGSGLDLENLKPGDTLRVPNVPPFRIEEMKAIASLPVRPELQSRSIHIDRADRMLVLREGESILAAFPITPGSERLPTPPGKWRVVGITSFPNFRWDEGVLERGVRTSEFHLLPPGPNNPVGVAWIALSKPGIGIHGTNTPHTIGRSASHGCMRLANWDASRLAEMVTREVRVEID
jgi:lipoprotein-anchoring transpeptidase ErfK/SrfK